MAQERKKPLSRSTGDGLQQLIVGRACYPSAFDIGRLLEEKAGLRVACCCRGTLQGKDEMNERFDRRANQIPANLCML